MIRLCVFLFCIFIVATSRATTPPPSDSDIAAVRAEINASAPTPDAAPTHMDSLISIDTDNPLDLNWSAALTFTGADATTPVQPVVLPFLHNHPINNLSIKLRVLDIQF